MNESRFRKSLVTIAVGGLLLSACGNGTERRSSDATSVTNRQRNAALISSPVNLAKVTKVHAGVWDTFALTDGKSIYHWGSSGLAEKTPPQLHEDAERFTQLSSGLFAANALDDQGRLYQWGSNIHSEFAPDELLDGTTRFTFIESDLFQTTAIDTEGIVHSWGYGTDGGLNLTIFPDAGTKFVDATGSYGGGASIDNNGKLYLWGTLKDQSPEKVQLSTGASKFVDAETTSSGIFILDDLGQLSYTEFHQYDLNEKFRQIPQLPLGARFTSIDVGSQLVSAVDDQGNVYVWGGGGNETLETPSKNVLPSQISSISFMYEHAAVMNEQGDLQIWGSKTKHFSPWPIDLIAKAPVMPIAAGGRQSYGINENGSIVQFDSSSDACCPPEEGSYIQVAAGVRHGLAIDRSGNVATWGEYQAGQQSVPWGLNNAIQVIAGHSYSAALTFDGRVYEWGSHVSQNNSLITKPDDVTNVVALAGGLTHVLALQDDGTVIGWGDNNFDKATPPDGLRDIKAIAAGAYCSAALSNTGAITYWGACTDSMTAVSQVENAISISVGDANVVIVKNDGSILAWGEEWTGLNEVPAYATDVVAVSVGQYHALAVKKNGNVLAWGDTTWGNTTIPSEFGGLDPYVPDEEFYEGGSGPSEPYVYTDEDIDALAGIFKDLPPDVREKVLKIIGPVEAKQNPIEDLNALVEKLANEKAKVLAVINNSSVVNATAAVLPTAQSPGLAIGSKVTTKDAVAKLGLKKVKNVSFVLPKKGAANKACKVSKSAVTAAAPGTCIVKVKYTDAKKKSRSTALTLLIG